MDSCTDESSEAGTPGTSGMANDNDCLDPLAQTQALLKFNPITLPTSNDDAWKVLDEEADRIVTAAVNLKNMVQEMKERTTQETEELRSQLQDPLERAEHSPMNPVVGHPQLIRIFDHDRTQTYTIELLDPDTSTVMQTSSATLAKCDNCGQIGRASCRERV